MKQPSNRSSQQRTLPARRDGERLRPERRDAGARRKLLGRVDVPGKAEEFEQLDASRRRGPVGIVPYGSP